MLNPDFDIEGTVATLRDAARAYYNDQPLMSDAEYDQCYDMLSTHAPDHPFLSETGSAPESNSPWEKVSHDLPMLSLNKAQSEEEVRSWWKDTVPSQPGCAILMHKMDGISVDLMYDNGNLVRASTRGNGTIGEDITRNVLRMKGVPASGVKVRAGTFMYSNGMNSEDFMFTGNIRGEIICKHSDFHNFPEASNPRNIASGVAKRFDGVGSEHLTVVCFAILTPERQPPVQSKYMELHILNQLGFEVVGNYDICTLDEVQDHWNHYSLRARSELDYDIDGLVVVVNDNNLLERRGLKNKKPKGAVAYKFGHESGETALLDVVWQVGNSGRVTPVAVFEEIHLGGAKIERASLHNISNIQKMLASFPQEALSVGDLLLVSRRNDVIPFVESVVSPNTEGASLLVPVACPECSTGLVREGEYLTCPNTAACPAQVAGRISNWLNKIGVLGWGPSTVEALVEQGVVSTIIDLYTLERDILAAVQFSGRVVGSSADAMLSDLHMKNKLDLHVALGSMGIPLWSRSMCKVLVDAGYQTPSDIIHLVENSRKANTHPNIEGIGQTKWEAFDQGFSRIWPQLEDMIESGLIQIKQPKVGGKLSGEVICFTGFRDKDLTSDLEEAGATMKSSYSSKVTILVAKDPNSRSSKIKKALSAGTRVISPDEVRTLL